MSAALSPWDRPGIAVGIDDYWNVPDEVTFRQQLVADLLPRLIGHTVLEFGCGSGRIYAALRDAGAFVTRSYWGMDSAHEMLKLAAARYPETAWSYGDILTSQAHADTVLVVQVLQHLADWRPALLNALRAARHLLYVVSWFSTGSTRYDADYDVWQNYLPVDEFRQLCAPYGHLTETCLNGTAWAMAVQLHDSGT